jgi:hypothetical protein
MLVLVAPNDLQLLIQSTHDLERVHHKLKVTLHSKRCQIGYCEEFVARVEAAEQYRKG